MPRKSLGRGLEALLPAVSTESVEPIPVESIDPNPHQPRKHFAPESLEELARSIRQQGLLQPVLVRRRGERYELIVGERRWRASMQAGLATLPALVTDRPDDRLLELALVENLQREDLGPLETAAAYKLLLERNHLTQEQLAELVGKKRSSVANYLRLLELPPEVKEAVQNERLSMGHARAISGLDEPELQKSVAETAQRSALSVREVEELVRRKKQRRTSSSSAAAPSKPAAAAPARPRAGRQDPHLAAAAERLSEVLGTPVAIEGSAERGHILVDYYSAQQLQALLERFEHG